MRRILTLLPIAVLLSLAGCGGGHHATAIHHPAALARTAQFPAPLINGHRCDPADYVMQCAPVGSAKAPPPPLAGASRTRSQLVLLGIDFAWSCPAPGTGNSRDFGVSYFSPDITKNWTVGCVNEWHGAHRATVGVYESTATRAKDSDYAGGRIDALLAARQAAAVGNVNRPIFFAIDFDATGPDVYPYFQGAQSILGSRVRAYGGALPTEYLCSKGITGNWVTYAWLYRTGDNWPSATCAPLEQYLNTPSFDYDRALLQDYGQWPGPVKPPPPDPYRFLEKTPRHFKLHNGTTVTANEYNTVKGWDHLKCENTVRRQSCKAIYFHLSLLAGRIWTVAHAFHPTDWGSERGARFHAIWSRLRSHGQCWYVGPKFVCS